MIKRIILITTFLFITISCCDAAPVNNFERIPDMFKNTCQRIQLEMDIPDWLLYAVPMAESSWNPNTPRSSANCIGLMQINPVYEKYLVNRYWTFFQKFDINNPNHNLWLGFKYLADLKVRFGTWEMALAAYNAGPTRVSTSPHDLPNETIDYIVTIKNMLYK